MKCCACGRELKSVESRKIGYGPVCYKTVFGISIKKKKDKMETSDIFTFPYYEIPGQITIDDYFSDSSE